MNKNEHFAEMKILSSKEIRQLDDLYRAICKQVIHFRKLYEHNPQCWDNQYIGALSELQVIQLVITILDLNVSSSLFNDWYLKGGELK